MYKVIFASHAVRDAKKLIKSKLKDKCLELIEIIKMNPYQNHPPYEKLLGELHGLLSRRINIHHRFVYAVFEKERIVKVLRMWTHYE